MTDKPDIRERRASYSAGSWALLASICGIIFIVNYFADDLFARLDLTEEKKYSLSKSTKDLLTDLDDTVTIHGIYSSNLTSPLNLLTRDVRYLLKEYAAHANGKVKLEFIDPTGDEETKRRLSERGILPFTIPTQGEDQAGFAEIYASVYVSYLDKSEVLPQVFSVESLEYNLTSTIDRLTLDKLPTVGILNPGGAREIDKEFGLLKNTIERRFQVIDVDTSQGPVGEEVDVLMVISPYRLSEQDLFHIDRFIMGGGKTVFLSEGTRVFLEMSEYNLPVPVYAMSMNPESDPLFGLLANYGVIRGYDMVMDVSNFPYPLFAIPYPPLVLTDFVEGDQPEHRITDDLDYMVFAWPSSLTAGATVDGVTVTPLVTTTPASWIQAGNQLLVDLKRTPREAFPMPGMGPETRTLAMLLTGSFPSYFADGDAPESAEGPAPVKSEQTSILVVGNSYFVSSMVPSGFPINQNLAFIMSALEWMTGGNELSDIQKRGLGLKPIPKPEGAKRHLVRFFFPFYAPLGVVVFGLARSLAQRSRRRKYLEGME